MKNERTLFRVLDTGPFYHGTKAVLKPGDLLAPGYSSKNVKRLGIEAIND